MRISALYRYPLKGFSPERLPRVALEAGGYFPADRIFAIENGDAGFDPAAPVHQAKIKFLMLMKNDEIARLSTRFDDDTGELSMAHEGREVVRGSVATEQGRAAITDFLTSYLSAGAIRGPLRLLTAPRGFRFTDAPSGFVSLINAASLAELEHRLGAPVDPLRFRGNILIEGLKPWEEFSLVGKVVEAPSGLRMRITKRIDRCAATAVDPQTGLRDLPVVRTLMASYGHIDCGVYADIIGAGSLAEGHRLRVIDVEERESLGL
ncbi:MAG: MOSC domain-containing protein [Hyphomicrobiales bacterium]|nr:MOSC domain-containing protein [Hyphomicrobiales bacterium]